MRKKRRHSYHLTTHDHGDLLIVRRRLPEQAADGEPPVPRLCVAKSPAACLAARLFYPSAVYVYRTITPCKGVTPQGVWDSLVTRERWLLPGQQLQKIDYLSRDLIKQAQQVVYGYHACSGGASTLHLRIAQYLLASRVLEASGKFPKDAWAETCAKLVGMTDPEEYIWEALRKRAAVKPLES